MTTSSIGTIVRGGVAAICLFGAATAVAQTPEEKDKPHFDKVERIIQQDLKTVGLAGQMNVARVLVNPGTKTPLHTHEKRTGIMVMLQGTLTEHRGDTVLMRTAGDVFEVVEGVTHWAENKGTVPVIYIETSTALAAPAKP
jgi:mannose-6-phosphate isomerase-like protein (cupin superfamily)